MKRNRYLICDALLWTLLMILAAVVAFNLLQRDKQRSFGAVSFGSFPEFSLMMPQGGTFDRHQIKGYVWAVHTASSVDEAMAVARQLAIIEKQTSSGKRHLNILTVSAAYSALTSLLPYHFIAGGSQEEVMTLRMLINTEFSRRIYFVFYKVIPGFLKYEPFGIKPKGFLY